MRLSLQIQSKVTLKCFTRETIQELKIFHQRNLYWSTLIPGDAKAKPNLPTGTASTDFDINLETPLGAENIHHTYRTHYQTIKEIDEIETEEISGIHLNLNQPPNQLQHKPTAPKSKKKRRKLTRFSKVLNPTGKKKTSFEI